MKAIDILILTKENCLLCGKARALFKRLAAEYPLTVSVLPVESPDGQDLARREQILFPPGIFIGGKAFCYGWPSRRKIRRELHRLMVMNRPDSGGQT